MKKQAFIIDNVPDAQSDMVRNMIMKRLAEMGLDIHSYKIATKHRLDQFWRDFKQGTRFE